MAQEHMDNTIQLHRASPTLVSAGLHPCIGLFMFAFSQVAMASPTVNIDGGVDIDGRVYTWNVTHDYESPIVFLKFPQDRANGLSAPVGWEGELERVKGNQSQSGYVAFKCVDQSRAIRSSQSTTFKLNLVWNGAARGVGDVIVRFADGTQIIATASIPITEPASDRNVSLIGLGTFFAIFLCVQAVRKRKQQSA